MTARPLLALFLAALATFGGALVACAEESRSIGDACEDVPLYRLVYDADSKTWTRVGADGGPLSDEDNARIDAELNRGESRCLTPTGSAVSSSPSGGGGGGSGGGGTAATDGGSGGRSSGGASGSGGASDSGAAGDSGTEPDAASDGG